MDATVVVLAHGYLIKGIPHMLLGYCLQLFLFVAFHQLPNHCFGLKWIITIGIMTLHCWATTDPAKGLHIIRFGGALAGQLGPLLATEVAHYYERH